MHCCEGCLQVRTTGPAVRKRAIYGANQRARTSSRSSSLAPSPTKPRREARGIVILIAMVISCYYGHVGSPSTASSRAAGQEHPAHDHAPHHADAGPDGTPELK